MTIYMENVVYKAAADDVFGDDLFYVVFSHMMSLCNLR